MFQNYYYFLILILWFLHSWFFIFSLLFFLQLFIQFFIPFFIQLFIQFFTVFSYVSLLTTTGDDAKKSESGKVSLHHRGDINILLCGDPGELPYLQFPWYFLFKIGLKVTDFKYYFSGKKLESIHYSLRTMINLILMIN